MCAVNCWRRWRTFLSFSVRSARSPRFVMENVAGMWMGIGSSIWMRCVTRSGLTCWAARRRLFQWGALLKACPSEYRSQGVLSKMNAFWVLRPL